MLAKAILIPAAGAAALFLAACGDSDEAESAAPVEMAPAAATEPTPAPAPPVVAPEAAQPAVEAPAPISAPPAAAATPANIGPPPPTSQVLSARLADASPIAGAELAGACLGCHTVDEGDRTIIGPNLFNVVGGPIAHDATFTYSAPMAALGTAGATWTYDRLDAFLAAPGAAVRGTAMSFAGIVDAGDRADVIAWLRLQSNRPAPMPEVTGALDDPSHPTYLALQASQGLEHFGRQTCGDCHGPTGGGGEGGPLKGPEFEARWDGRSVWELYNLTRRTMPPAEAGGLPDERYAQIIAYILQLNGYEPGENLLPVTRAELEAMRFEF